MEKQIIMTSPTNFGVHYDINPWMENNQGKVDKIKSIQQWSDLRNVLVLLGVDVIVMPTPPEYCPDAVFTANAGLIYNGTFIPSYFRHEERAVEEPYFTEWMAERFTLKHDDIKENRSKVSFEGAGDALFDKRDYRNLWFGFGFRTSFEYKKYLDNFFDGYDILVRPLQLVNPNFYHLDTCFCPLDTGELLWYPEAFSEYSQSVIRGMFATKSIEVPREDAFKFACNAVSVGSAIVLPKITPFLNQHLKNRGYSVFEVDMDEYLKSGGACKCLTIEVVE